MECNDEAVERQKLVSNECDEDDQNTITNISTSTGPQKLSPVLSKVFSSSSQNSTSCSLGKGNTDSSGLPSSRLIYVNERKSQDSNSKIDYKSKTRRIQRGNCFIINRLIFYILFTVKFLFFIYFLILIVHEYLHTPLLFCFVVNYVNDNLVICLISINIE